METATLQEEDLVLSCPVLPSPAPVGQGWCQWAGDAGLGEAAVTPEAPQTNTIPCGHMSQKHFSMGCGNSPHCLNLCGATSQRSSSPLACFLPLSGRASSPPHPTALFPRLPSPTPTCHCLGFPYSIFFQVGNFYTHASPPCPCQTGSLGFSSL